MATPLFTNDEATDPGYRSICDAKKGPLGFARWHCQYLWRVFERHADKEFRKELRRTFDARYWEMYLTTSLIKASGSGSRRPPRRVARRTSPTRSAKPRTERCPKTRSSSVT